MVTKPGTGASLAFVCLGLLGLMPIIANSRPDGFGALSFASFLSAWQLAFSLPLFVRELRSDDRGIFAAALDTRVRWRAMIIAFVTGTMFGLSTYLYVLGVQKAGAVSAAIAIQAYPFFAILWESLFLRRRKTLLELAFTGTLLLALYYLGTGATWQIEGLSPWFVVALGVPFLWSIAHVLIKEELGRTPITPAQITFFRVLVSTIVLAGVLALSEPSMLLRDMARWDFQRFALVMGLVYYLELIIWFHAVRHIDVSLASSITTPWPVLTMLLAFVFLGDTVTMQQVGAFCIVAISIYGLLVVGVRKARSHSASPHRETGTSKRNESLGA